MHFARFRNSDDSVKRNIELYFGSRLENLEIVQGISDSIGRLMGLDDDGRYWICLSVRESVTNAILHGNKKDVEKRVGVKFFLTKEKLVITIQDEGNGFDEARLPDPLDPDNLLKPSGRGIFYVRSFMDEVKYQSLPEGGWEVRMEKRFNNKQQGEKK
jgi:serine/threonine-protein kinase RsbW